MIEWLKVGKYNDLSVNNERGDGRGRRPGMGLGGGARGGREFPSPRRRTRRNDAPARALSHTHFDKVSLFDKNSFL
jgi:hypothetical protein